MCSKMKVDAQDCWFAGFIDTNQLGFKCLEPRNATDSNKNWLLKYCKLYYVESWSTSQLGVNSQIVQSEMLMWIHFNTVILVIFLTKISQ